MFKVVCIREPNYKQCPITGELPIICVGGFYTVIAAFAPSGGFAPMHATYELAEHPEFLYAQKLFARTSDIDECEIHKDINKVSRIVQKGFERGAVG